MNEVAASPFFHRHYYEHHLTPSLFHDANDAADPLAEDWSRHVLLATGVGIGAELFAALHVLRVARRDGFVLIITPNGSSTTAVVGELQPALQIVRRLAPDWTASSDVVDPISVVCVDDGTAPERRAALYQAHPVVVLQARVALTDLLCRRLSSLLVRGVVVWDADRASEATAFALTLLRDLDRGSSRRLAALGQQPPPRCVLSIAADLAAVRPSALDRLNPSVVRLVPRISSTLVTWLKGRPQAVLYEDVASCGQATTDCERALRNIVDELLADLASAGSAVFSELQQEYLGQTSVEARESRSGPDAGVSARRHYAERAKAQREAQDSRKNLPSYTFEALRTRQLDALLERLTSRPHWGARVDVHAVATSLRQLGSLARALESMSAPSFALALDNVVSAAAAAASADPSRRAARNMPLWCVSESAGPLLAAAAARVLEVDELQGTLRCSAEIAGRYRMLREVLAGVVRSAEQRPASQALGASSPTGEGRLDDVTIMVGSTGAMCDTVHALWQPTLLDLEDSFLKDFARQYRRRFVPPENYVRDPNSVAEALSRLRDDETIAFAEDMEEAVNGSADEAADGDLANSSSRSTATQVQSQLASQAPSLSSGLSLHERLLELGSQPSQLPSSTQTPIQPTQDRALVIDDDIDSDDDVECVGEGGSVAIPLAADEVLFPGARVEFASSSHCIVVTRTARFNVVHRRSVTLDWLLGHDPRSILLLDADLRMCTLLELYAALRVPLHGWACDAPPPVVRRLRTTHGANGSVDPVKQELAAERAALARLGELRSTHVSQVVASGRSRQLVEREVRWLAAANRRRGLLQRADAAAERAIRRQQPRWQTDLESAPTYEVGPAVIVDMRELRSTLPFRLFQQGLSVIPVTLITGDYVLSPCVAVERKSLRDLCQSLASGRIAAQLRALEGRYQYPILLIEFSRTEPFRLRHDTVWRGSDDASGVASKLVRACALHPRLIVLWARSPDHAAELVAQLKVTVAVENADPADPALTTAADATHHLNVQTAKDMLLRLPGVHGGNAQRLMDAARSLAGLIALSEAEMKAALGNVDGAALHSFLHSRHHTAPTRANHNGQQSYTSID
jgi:ERCC4-type nuclease